MAEPRLRIALQKSGRLHDGSMELLEKCGFRFSKSGGKLYARAKGFPMDALFVRDDDIPRFVADGACDLGIVGENVFKETVLEDPTTEDAELVMPLGFARCRLALAAPDGGDINRAADLAGKRVATTYPALVQDYFKREGIEARVALMKGSVEVAPRMRIADAIVDIVSTGATLEANGLSVLDTILESEALLIRRPGGLEGELGDLAEALYKRIRGVIQSRDAKYIMMNAPRSAVEGIRDILPGAEAPTILDLAGESDKVAIHAVCGESVFWDTLEKLKAMGASAILVLNIEKMML